MDAPWFQDSRWAGPVLERLVLASTPELERYLRPRIQEALADTPVVVHAEATAPPNF
jgi:hypothetical protein